MEEQQRLLQLEEKEKATARRQSQKQGTQPHRSRDVPPEVEEEDACLTDDDQAHHSFLEDEVEDEFLLEGNFSLHQGRGRVKAEVGERDGEGEGKRERGEEADEVTEWIEMEEGEMEEVCVCLCVCV
jgi:hypothetical protein